MNYTEEQIEKLFDQHSSAVKYFCLKRFNSQDIDDSVQNALMKAFLNIHTYDPEISSFKTWLCKIANNECVDSFRKKQRKKNNGIYFENIDNRFIERFLFQNSLFYEENFDNLLNNDEPEERQIRLIRLIKVLSEKEIKILYAKYGLGMSCEKIANFYGYSNENVRAIMSRSWKKIRDRKIKLGYLNR